jgi:hypothetical protein
LQEVCRTLCTLAAKAGVRDYTRLATDPSTTRPVTLGLDHTSAWTDGRTGWSLHQAAAGVVEAVVWQLHQAGARAPSALAVLCEATRSEPGAGAAEAAGILACLYSVGCCPAIAPPPARECAATRALGSLLLGAAVDAVPGLVRLALSTAAEPDRLAATTALWRLAHMHARVCGALLAALGAHVGEASSSSRAALLVRGPLSALAALACAALCRSCCERRGFSQLELRVAAMLPPPHDDDDGRAATHQVPASTPPPPPLLNPKDPMVTPIEFQ